MKSKITDLINVLNQIAELLEWDGEFFWRNAITGAKSELLNSDLSGIDTLLNMYGAMGSFNDLIIGRTIMDKRFIWKDGGEDKDKRLRALQSKAFNLAMEIRNIKEGS